MVPSALIILRNHVVMCDGNATIHEVAVPKARPLTQLTKNDISLFMECLRKILKNIWKKIYTFFSSFKRIIICTGLTLPALVLAPGCLYFRQEEILWNYIIWAIEKLGPTFIKLAQWGSSRPDIFPEELIARLERFTDSTTTYPFYVAERTLTKAFGPDWDTHLNLNREPIGAGCIAQVYKGTVINDRGDSIPVAVKLIHPHVQKMVTRDMEILQFFAHLFETLVPRLEYLSMSDTVQQFSENMHQQMDLRNEAAHIHTFIKNFKDNPAVIFPIPIDDYVTSNVLVETFVEGTPINQYMKKTVPKKLQVKISELAARIMLLMVFRDNFVHGDLHPGNILVQETSTGPKIVLLDCGIVTQVAKERHGALVDTCLAFLYWDGRKAAQTMLDHSSKNLCANKEQEELFVAGIQKIVEKSKESVYFENVGSYIAEICRLSCQYRVKLISDFLQVALAVKVVEGISLALDSDLDLTSKAIPIVLKAQAKLLLKKTSQKIRRQPSE